MTQLTETIELRFHRLHRPAAPVGMMKNGASIFWMTTCNGEKIYLVRRGAKSETAKGYTQASELTLKQLETATLSDPRARAQAIDILRGAAASCERQIQFKYTRIENDAEWLAKATAAGDEGWKDSSGSLLERATSIPEREEGATHIEVPTQSMWAESHRTFTNRSGRQPNLWLPKGWQDRGAHCVNFKGAFDTEITAIRKEAIRWNRAADRLEAVS